MKMLGILFDQVDNFGKYEMKYITWHCYGNEGWYDGLNM